MKQAVLLLTSPKVQSGFLGVNQLVTGLFLPSYPFKIPRSVPGFLWALLRLSSVSVGWTEEDKASCSLLKDSAAVYYVASPDKVCPWSQGWLKANPFPFLEKQLKTTWFLGAAVLSVWPTKTTYWTLTLDTMGNYKMSKLLKDVKLPSKHSQDKIWDHKLQKHCTWYYSISRYVCHSHLKCWIEVVRRVEGSGLCLGSLASGSQHLFKQEHLVWKDLFTSSPLPPQPA